jgi:hypothetical protein
MVQVPQARVVAAVSGVTSEACIGIRMRHFDVISSSNVGRTSVLQLTTW